MKLVSVNVVAMVVLSSACAVPGPEEASGDAPAPVVAGALGTEAPAFDIPISVTFYPVTGAIYAKWRKTPSLGSPTGYEQTTSEGGRRQTFTGGTVSWHPATGAWVVRGAILTKWLSLGAEGWWGYPTSDEEGTGDSYGRVSRFSTVWGGKAAEPRAIYWTRHTGAHGIRGDIYLAYFWKGGPGGPVGYPIGEEHAITPADYGQQFSKLDPRTKQWGPTAIFWDTDQSPDRWVWCFPTDDKSMMAGCMRCLR